QHFESSYPEIQHLALNVAADLIDRNSDKDINDKWNDLHHTENPKLFVKALRILVHVANTFKGRKDYLWQMLKHSVEQVPVKISIIALEILLTIAHLIFRDTMINFDTIDTICLLLKSTHPFVNEFKIAYCKLLPALCLEESGQPYFLKAKGFQRIFKAIANRICLTAAFVRGKYGVSWIEIAISQIIYKMEDSNQGRLYDACLDGNNEEYEKRITTELLGKTNSVKILADSETMTLERALAPLMTIGAFCNLAMFEYPPGQPRTYISCLYGLAKWSLFTYLFYYPCYIITFKMKTIYILDIVSLVSIILILISFCRFKVKI
ncbi:hypothetical protein ALC57_16875, partial [Trachymyrmex cornetzi]